MPCHLRGSWRKRPGGDGGVIEQERGQPGKSWCPETPGGATWRKERKVSGVPGRMSQTVKTKVMVITRLGENSVGGRSQWFAVGSGDGDEGIAFS